MKKRLIHNTIWLVIICGFFTFLHRAGAFGLNGELEPVHLLFYVLLTSAYKRSSMTIREVDKWHLGELFVLFTVVYLYIVTGITLVQAAYFFAMAFPIMFITVRMDAFQNLGTIRGWWFWILSLLSFGLLFYVILVDTKDNYLLHFAVSLVQCAYMVGLGKVYAILEDKFPSVIGGQNE